LSYLLLSEVCLPSWVTSCHPINTKTCCTYFQRNQATENRHFKTDLPQLPHIYKSGHEGNNTQFSKEVGYTFC